MKTKKLRLALILASVAAFLSACGSNSNGADSSSSASGSNGGKVTLTISRWAGPHADDQKEMLKQFEQETGITVKMDDVDYAQLQQKQTLNLSNKTGEYDLVWAQEIWIPEYVKNGYLLPIDAYVKDDSLNPKDFDFADYNPNLIKIVTADGKLYGLPTFIQLPIMVYNKDILQEEGLTPPKTWDETLAVAKHFHDKGTGIALPSKQGQAAVDVFTSLIRSNGGDYFGADGKLDLSGQASMEAANFWKDLNAVAMNGSATWHYDEVTKAVQSGQAPIGLTISGQIGSLEDQANSSVAGKIGYAPLPYSKQPFGTLSVWNWCVAADSKHPKEAYELAAWLTSKETEKAMSLKDGQMPGRQSLFSDPELSAKYPFFPAVGEAMKQADTQPLIADAPKLMDQLATALSAIAVGNTDPQAALAQVQQDMASASIQ
ncbi:sugar ABC transporter substrate-binding protein [Paenibacillus sp. ATY16]|uniref:ABC transporter substrate-binding protein n=1 Tax=Paenibacillus sp. ATY16 TaxID=1759312 RepID=UPI00200DB83C|nr:sugar ABC transporter substrate-binding protein [Paenibacillus sp. ATY16]MCK9858646.1 sugar ABC transporter substrate-binding protein [Paenibacillus sp. ATY16]